MKSAQQRAESAVNSLLKSPKLGWVQCFSHEKTEAASIILRETGLEGLVKVEECAREVVAVWKQQLGRVFESMGGDNPRAQAIDEAITNLEQRLIQIETGRFVPRESNTSRVLLDCKSVLRLACQTIQDRDQAYVTETHCQQVMMLAANAMDAATAELKEKLG